MGDGRPARSGSAASTTRTRAMLETDGTEEDWVNGKAGTLEHAACLSADRSPAVTFATPCAPQYTAETAGSKAHPKRTGCRNICLAFYLSRQSVGTKCGDKVLSAEHPL